MKPIRILAIGNSFSQDAFGLLHAVAEERGLDVETVNLYIGGCSLGHHYRNIYSEEKEYQLYLNGAQTPFKLSIKEALLADDWDIVTFQQVSSKSGDYSTYEPYLSELSSYVKKLAPLAKQYIHAIWAWSDERLSKSALPYSTSAQMTACDNEAYALAARAIGADGYIPATIAMEKLYRKIGDAAYRDGSHASLGVGRYMLALLWFGVIFGREVCGIEYRDFDEEVTEEELLIAESCVKETLAKFTYEKI
jgi:hypothetical protein